MPLYCIDSSIYISWLDKETVEWLDKVGHVIGEIETREAGLVFPVHIYTELMEAKHKGDSLKALREFRQFLNRSNIVLVDITMAVADRAERLRSEAYRLKPSRVIRTSDSLIAAAAILNEARILLTNDDKLLGLNKSPIVDGLWISRPRTISDQLKIGGAD